MSTTIARRALVSAADRRRCQQPLPTPAERRRLREEAGFSREEIALAVGCTIRSVYRWEAGAREPRGVYVSRYANVLEALARDLARQATRTKNETPKPETIAS